VTIIAGQEELALTAGHSAFIAAAAGAYRLSARTKTEILKSFII